MTQHITSTGQRIGISVSVLPEYSGLISFRIDQLDLLAVQETLKSLLQHHSSKVSILQCLQRYDPTLTSTHDYQEKTELWLYGPSSAK